MKKITKTITILTMAIGSIFICTKSLYFFTGLLFVPFIFFPLIISLFLIDEAEAQSSIVTLLAGNVIFNLWFLYMFLSVFYWYPDPQGSIALLFTGLYSLPLMIIIWLLSDKLNKNN